MNTTTLIILLVFELIIFIRLFKGEQIDSRLQYETDIRLTYKRYQELYPDSPISYENYKRIQTRQAFRKAVSSRKIKRMVK